MRRIASTVWTSGFKARWDRCTAQIDMVLCLDEPLTSTVASRIDVSFETVGCGVHDLHIKAISIGNIRCDSKADNGLAVGGVFEDAITCVRGSQSRYMPKPVDDSSIDSDVTIKKPWRVADGNIELAATTIGAEPRAIAKAPDNGRSILHQLADRARPGNHPKSRLPVRKGLNCQVV